MSAPLLGVVRADLDRQMGWARDEFRRQARHVVLIGAIAAVAALTALGALTVGVIALYSWLAMQFGPFAALGMIGAGLLLLTAILALAIVLLRRPRIAARPTLQMARPATLFGAFGQGRAGQAIAGTGDSFKLATDTLRDGSRSELVGALALVAVVGLIAGRRLRRTRPEEKQDVV